jgi:hypothetical protein
MFSKQLVGLSAALILATTTLASANMILSNGRIVDPDHGKKPAIKAGIVSSTGAIVQGTGFVVSHDGTGEYTIDFPAGTFTNCPAIIATGSGINTHTPVANVFNYVSCGNNGEVKAQLRMYSNSGSGLQDNSFHFVLVEII